jgi:hypothetical protein
MPIRCFLSGTSLQPQEIELLNLAYQAALRSLSLVDRNDPIVEIVAKKVIEIGQTGLHDPGQISQRALKELGVT